MLDVNPAYTPGRLETQTRADVAALSTAHPMGDSLAEGAFYLARVLDEGVEAKSAAGIFRELRMTLVELSKLGVPDDGGFGAGLGVPETGVTAAHG